MRVRESVQRDGREHRHVQEIQMPRQEVLHLDTGSRTGW